jgi:hypothetical protein
MAGDLDFKGRAHLPPEEQLVTALPDIATRRLRGWGPEVTVLACDGLWDCRSSQQVGFELKLRLRRGYGRFGFPQCVGPGGDYWQRASFQSGRS